MDVTGHTTFGSHPGPGQEPRKAAGIRDVAQAADVSYQTVSRVAALYYASPDEALTHFPSYERSLREQSTGPGGFYDPSRSFVLYSREVTVFQRP